MTETTSTLVSDYCDALERGERPIMETGRRTGKQAFQRAVAREMAARNPLSVPCPNALCGAAAGRPCPPLLSGAAARKHLARRVQAARAAVPDRLVPVEVVCLMEDTLQDGQAEHGNRWRTKSVAHHVGKGISHAVRGLGANPIDPDSGQHHLVLGATRLVLAVAVMLDRERDR